MGRMTTGASKLQAVNDPAPGLTAQLIRTTRYFLADGGTIEEALDTVLEAARREFLCRIVVSNPARFIVDGGRFEWPVASENALLPGDGKGEANGDQ